MTVDAKIKSFFFDKEKVRKLIGDKSAKALSKIGAFVQRRARTSLRRRKRVSSPGQTPSVHSQSDVATLKNIQFGLGPANLSVVIGPLALNQVNNVNAVVANGTVPNLMEFGGTARITEVRVANKWFRRDGRRTLRPGEVARVRTANYAARPFMGPALAAEVAAGTIPDAWGSSVNAA